MTAREVFLDRVRKAVVSGQVAGHVPPLPERGSIGWQGGGPDAVERFCIELKAAGGHPHVVPNNALAISLLQELLDARRPKRVILGKGPILDDLQLRQHLQAAGRTITLLSDVPASEFRQQLFAADLCISGVTYLVAETGTVVATTRPEEPRGLTLLPPIHVAAAHRCQLLPDLFDLFAAFQQTPPNDEDFPVDLPSCLTLITGPSKTGDIELKLVTGVHGPGELHVVLIDDARP